MDNTNKISKTVLSTTEILNLIHHMELDEEKFQEDLDMLRTELRDRKVATVHNAMPGLH